MIPTPYWHDPEWRALLLAVVDQPEDVFRWMRCADWLQESGQHKKIEWWETNLHYPLEAIRWQGTSAEWYRQDANGVYPCKELAWTLPIREVVFADVVTRTELKYWLSQPYDKESRLEVPTTRSELALRFARS